MSLTEHVAPLTGAEEYLLDLLRVRPATAGMDRATAGRSSPDWGEILEIATPLLHPWLHHRLGEIPGSGGAPGRVLEKLGEARRASALLHIRRREELRGILSAFERAGVPALVLKGMALACLVYPDPSLRPMLDIDLLVPAGALDEARGILRGLGFEVPLRHAFRPETGATAIAESEKPMQRPGTRMMVDLHGGLDFGSGGGSARWAASIFDRAREAHLDGVPARVPGPEDLLVHTCFHLSERHLFDRGLPPLLDVALLLERKGGGIRWEVVARIGEAPGGGAGLLLPLKLARNLLGAPVPPDLLEGWPGDDRSREVERLATEQVLRTGKDHVSPGLVELAMQPRSRRLAHLARRLYPWRREDRGMEGSVAGVARAGTMAAKRLGADLLTRARIYLGAWHRGNLTRAGLDRAIRLRQGRDRLAVLMEISRDEAAGPPTPSSRRSGAGGD